MICCNSIPRISNSILQNQDFFDFGECMIYNVVLISLYYIDISFQKKETFEIQTTLQIRKVKSIQ